MRFVSLFAGVGGFDLGFEQAGWECVGQVELDKHARSVLERQWPDVPKHDDVTTAREWADGIGLRGRVDVVCGGFPCQPFSVAGKRLGREDLRGNLFWNALAFATHVEAGIVVMENVPGLLTSDSGRTFGDILASLADAGYEHVEWRVLDSQFYGVPQRRRRVFIVAGRDSGIFGGRSVLTQPEGVRWHPSQGGEEGQDAASPAAGGFAGRSVVNALTANGLGGGGADDNLAQAGHLVSQPHSTAVETTAGSEPNQVSTSSSGSAFSMTQYGGYTEGVGTMSATDYKRPEHHVVVES
jgi:DNA-cytosine methyltransferase